MLKPLKKGLLSLLFSSFILCSGVSIFFTNPANAEQQQQPYAKWGMKAVEAVKHKFPDSKLSDYEYLGTNTTIVNEWQDNFHIIVSKDGKKKLVRVTVSYDPKTSHLKKVTIKEEKCE